MSTVTCPSCGVQLDALLENGQRRETCELCYAPLPASGSSPTGPTATESAPRSLDLPPADPPPPRIIMRPASPDPPQRLPEFDSYETNRRPPRPKPGALAPDALEPSPDDAPITEPLTTSQLLSKKREAEQASGRSYSYQPPAPEPIQDTQQALQDVQRRQQLERSAESARNERTVNKGAALNLPFLLAGVITLVSVGIFVLANYHDQLEPWQVGAWVGAMVAGCASAFIYVLIRLVWGSRKV